MNEIFTPTETRNSTLSLGEIISKIRGKLGRLKKPATPRVSKRAIFENAFTTFSQDAENNKNIPALLNLAQLAMDEKNSLPAARTLLSMILKINPEHEDAKRLFEEINQQD